MLHRFPEGTGGERIYQKRLPKGAPDWVETVQVRFPSGRAADELCVTELASVIWAVQMSSVEFHPWHSRRADTERPDELRIDLDPQPGTDFADAVEVAGVVRELLAELGAIGWPKTSGSRGLHIYLRIQPAHGFTQVRRAALALAREIERRVPDLVTTKWWKEERGEQIFIDYNQNARDRTIASAYSIRASTGLVSAPISWEELPEVRMQDFTMATMPARFAELGDLHAGIDEAVFDISPLLDWSERDEHELGQGDAPYPPTFPKMEGEPPRVQPSKKVAAHWDEHGERLG
jgi:DNA ligase D-like protein (predicted polymerase)